MGALNPRLIAAALALLAAFFAGWVAQGWRKDAALQELRDQHAAALQAIADKTATAQEAVRRYEQATAKNLAELDKQKTQEIADAQSETNRLRACITAGTCGVRLNTTPGAATGGRSADVSTPGVGDAAAALDADVQRRVLDLRDAIALDSAALEYLQGFAQQCAGQAQELR